MSETMIETLRRKRATTAIRSMAMSEINEQHLHNKAKAAREQLGNTNGINEDTELTAQLAHHYYHMKASYSGKRVQTRVVDSARRQQFWGKVQTCCKTADVTPERYMKAQFSFFHIAFGTTPKLNQLATEAAIERAQSFEGKTSGKVVGNAIESGVSLGSLFARCEQQVRDICRAQSVTREEYYRIFVIPGLISMPHEFLSADPVYQEVANESRRPVR